MKLSFEVLEALDAIDRTGTFTEAAGLLNRVPSSLTYLIQKLETELAVKLFECSGRRAKLTHAGRVVVEEGRCLLSAAEQLERKARRVQDGCEAELRICLDEIFPIGPMWRYMHDFYALKMDTNLRFSREILGGTWDALITRRADLVIGATGEPPRLPHLVARPIGSLRHIFAVAPGHPLAAMPEPISMDIVMRYRGVVIGDTSRKPESGTDAAGATQECIAVPTLAAKLDAQCEGLAAGTLPECLAARAIGEGKLVPKRVSGIREITYCYLAWRDDESGRALKWWVEQLDFPNLTERFVSSSTRTEI